MEDPWSSPWATDTPAPPTIDLPSEPQQAHVVNTPRKSSRSPSPWGRNTDDAEDDWGGWKEASAGKDSPGWGRSPNLRPLGTATVLDPWALGEEEKERERGADSAISLGDDGRDVRDEETNGKAVEGHDLRGEEADEKTVDGQDTKDEEANGIETVDWNEAVDEETDGKSAADHGEKDEQRNEIQEQLEEVRDEEIDRGTSPAIDEPTKALGVERPIGSRQPSKVQELVEMYDGMARTPSVETSSTEEREEVSRDEVECMSTSEVSNKAEGPDATPDEEVANDNLHQDGEESNISEADDVPLADSPEVGEGMHELKEPETAQSVEPVEPAAQDSTRNTELPQPTSYAIDFSILDTLFPGTEPTSTIPEQLPESIIKESFDSVSQRKAWYRISRFGSMRKHNHGDDDNYVRVGWNNSTVRKDTLTTVRRWMEEDSIGGRVILGRRLGHGGGGMFNWDSEAPAVEIGELLARKKPKPKPARHARQVSATVEGSITSPTIPAFGWSSSVPASPVTGRFSSEWHAKPSRLAETSEASTVQAVQPHVEAVDAEDDDDWGEMVSSPTMDSSEKRMNVAETLPARASMESAQPQPTMESAAMSMNTIAETLQVPAELSHDLPQPITPTIEPDPWGGLDMFGGHSTEKEEAASPVLSKPPTSPTLTTSMTTPSTFSSTQPTDAEKWHTTTPMASQPTSIELSSQTDNAAVATILAGLPDLSYMLK